LVLKSLRFKGERRGGGPEGWAPHGGGAGGREGERGGHGRGGDSVVVRRRAAAARPRRARQGRAAGSGRCRTAWLTGGQGRDGGPVISGWVRREAAR
jgi:hypothetical protein